MARIEEFEAKDVKLTPSDKGYAAVEMAARRIGPLYGQMAAAQRELGSLTKGSDEAIGKTAEAFLRFQGLSQQSSGAGVKVGKGGAGERTLLGTGAGGDTSWNARANASNIPGIGKTSAAATGTGQTADQAANAAVGITAPLTPAQRKAANKVATTLKAEQAADKLKADRNLEDKNIASKREQEDLDTKIYWDKLGPISGLTGTIQGKETQAQADARAQMEMQVAKDTQASALKNSRLQENSDLQQQRDAQDAAVKEGRTQLTLQQKMEIANGAPKIADLAHRLVAANSPAAAQQQASDDRAVLSGALTGDRVPSHIAENPDTEPKKTGEAASDLGIPTDLGGGYSPTFLGDVPAIPAQRETPANAPPSPEPSADSQDIGPPTPASSQTIQTPIDQPGDVPGLYSDMTGGM